ncbi:MAG: hypothetical protein CMJ54_03570 [Planctomycetaceae bacterium]|nr:hypothetical protein [Planctomycetaceae bacterium]
MGIPSQAGFENAGARTSAASGSADFRRPSLVAGISFECRTLLHGEPHVHAVRLMSSNTDPIGLKPGIASPDRIRRAF